MPSPWVARSAISITIIAAWRRLEDNIGRPCDAFDDKIR